LQKFVCFDNKFISSQDMDEKKVAID
jgi:hypothetical protein